MRSCRTTSRIHTHAVRSRELPQVLRAKRRRLSGTLSTGSRIQQKPRGGLAPPVLHSLQTSRANLLRTADMHCRCRSLCDRRRGRGLDQVVPDQRKQPERPTHLPQTPCIFSSPNRDAPKRPVSEMEERLLVGTIPRATWRRERECRNPLRALRAEETAAYCRRYAIPMEEVATAVTTRQPCIREGTGVPIRSLREGIQIPCPLCRDCRGRSVSSPRRRGFRFAGKNRFGS